MMQFRPRQPLGMSAANTTAGESQKGYSRPPMNRNHSTHGLEIDKSEFENILERERKVFKENMEKTDSAFDRQKKQRLELESRLITAKQEISKRDKEIAEVRYKLESVLQDNHNIALENEHLRRDLESARQAYEYKVEQLQIKLTEGQSNYRNAAERYIEQYESFRQEGQDYIDVLTFQHDRLKKSLQDNVRRLQQRNNDLLADTKRLNDQLAYQQLTYEEQIRSSINRVREQEQRKYNSSLLGLQQKIKTSESIKESLSRKNQELLKHIQEKQNTLLCTGADRSEECATLRQQIATLKERIGQMKLLIDRANAELMDKDQLLSQKGSDMEAQNYQLRQKLDHYKHQIDELNETVRTVRREAKEAACANQRRNQQLLERCNYHQAECQRYRNESVNTWQHLKLKLNQTIESIGKQ